MISQEGRTTSPRKTAAILNAKVPRTKKEVRPFLGMVNYFSPFIPNASTITKPLRVLTEQLFDFHWTESCQEAFDKCKEILASETVLMHYDPRLPKVVSSDASPVGLGATLSHVVTFNDKTVERPVCYASCSLNERQQRYFQLDREAHHKSNTDGNGRP